MQDDQLLPALSEAHADQLAIVQTLERKAAEYATKSHGDGTVLAYRSAWSAYVEWCASLGREPLDGNPQTLALYVTTRAADLTMSSIRVHVAAVSTAHNLAGKSMNTQDHTLSQVLRGIARTNGVRPTRKAAAATSDTLRQLLAACEPSDTPKGARNRAMLLIGFGAALRRSELVALDVSDVEDIAGRGLSLTIRRSKTDQVGAGVVVSVAHNPLEAAFCPARAFRSWAAFRRLDGGSKGPGAAALFTFVSEAGKVTPRRLNDRTVARIIKGAAEDSGFSADEFSGHSLRRGFMTEAASAGVSLPNIMRQSRHKSPQTAIGYIDAANAWSDNASEAVFRSKQ